MNKGVTIYMDKKYIERSQTDIKSAQQRATKKFYENNRTLKIDLTNDFFDEISDYCKHNNLTKRQFIELATAEYMSNH